MSLSANSADQVPTIPEQEGFKRSLSLFDGIMLVSGIMIGSGIFLTSAEISRTVGGSGWLMVVWILGGFMTVAGALSYGELATMFPQAGGQYIFLREAYNPLTAFLFGWAFFIVIQCGTIAAVAVAFAKYTAFVFPQTGSESPLLSLGKIHISISQVIAIGMIMLLSYINTRGINKGKFIQGVFTVTKILALALLIIFGFTAIRHEVFNLNIDGAWMSFHYDLVRNPVSHYAGPTHSYGIEAIGLIGVAMVGALFSSDAWNSVTYVASEVRNPRKNMVRSLFYGTLLVTILYILCNFIYITILPVHDIAFAPGDRVAASVAFYIFGETGAILIAVLIMVSTFGCDNGLILSGARVYYTMANDKLFFKSTGKLNKKGVPANGIWIQATWASLLCLSGSYSDLLNYVIFVVLIFYILTIAGIFVLRKKRPEIPRSYKAPGYPFLQIIYILMAAIICISLLIYRPLFTWPGLILVAIGIPIFFFLKRREPKL